MPGNFLVKFWVILGNLRIPATPRPDLLRGLWILKLPFFTHFNTHYLPIDIKD